MKKYKIGLGADDIGYIEKELTEEQYQFLLQLQKELDNCPVQYMGWMEIQEIK